MKHSKKGLIVASLDGIASLYSGVGVVVDSVFENFDRIESDLALDEYDVHAAVPLFDHKTDDFSAKQLSSIELFCRQRGGKVHHLDNLCYGLAIPEIWRGTDNIKTTEQWNSLCISLSNLAYKLLDDYECLAIICHDTLFANTSAFLNRDLNRIKLCWIPHSLSVLFEDELNKERLVYERESISAILKAGHKIGYISNQTKEILASQFKVNEDSFISFYSGIYFNSQKYELTDLSEINNLIETIPRKKKLIFTWGRCVYQKGIDLAIDAFGKISETTDEYHLMMICPTSNSTPEFLSLIKRKLSLLKKGSYTLIQEYHNRLPMLFINSKKTEYVFLPSRFEGFGIIAIEAAIISRPKTKILYSSLPTFGEVLEVLPNAFSFEVDNINSLLEAFNRSKKTVNVNPNISYKKDLIKKYDLIENYSKGIECLINSK